MDEILRIGRRAVRERDELMRLGEALVSNSWYSKDPKWWTAVDKAAFERFSDFLSLTRSLVDDRSELELEDRN